MNLAPSDASLRQGVGVSSAEGLPPLPRGLSGVLGSSRTAWRHLGHGERASGRADDGRGDAAADATRAQRQLGGLYAALALLQKEMADLRRLDTSLLCRLWSLHEDIQEYKHSEALFSADTGYSEEEDEVEEEYEEKGVTSQCPPSLSLSLPPPSSNSRDQWIKDSFNVP